MDREHGAAEACEFVQEPRLRPEQPAVRLGVRRGSLSARRAAGLMLPCCIVPLTPPRRP